MESKYLERFKRASKLIPLRGDRLLVEVLPKEEIKTAGGLIIQGAKDHKSTADIHRALVAVVVAVGNGYYDDTTGEDKPMDLQPGNVVLLSEFGLKYYSQFPGLTEYTGETLALTRDHDVHCAWESLETFREYTKALNQ